MQPTNILPFNYLVICSDGKGVWHQDYEMALLDHAGAGYHGLSSQLVDLTVDQFLNSADGLWYDIEHTELVTLMLRQPAPAALVSMGC